MSLNLNFVLAFDGSNYGYWKARMRFFLKSIDIWHIVESGWTPPEAPTAEWTIIQTHSCLSNDKALNAICQTLSPSEFSRISHCEIAREAWEILETTFEGIKIVKSAKLQMLVSQFEGIKMLEYEYFSEFYTKITYLRNSMINLGKKVSDVKLIKKILRSLSKRFRIKVTTIEESKDLDEMKVEELVGSLLTYELTLPPVKKAKSIALKTSKGKRKVSSDEETDDEHGLAMLVRKFSKLIESKRFRKFTDNFQGNPKSTEQEKGDINEKDPRGPRCFECSGFGHIQADCGNLKHAKGKALNATLSNDSDEEETPGKDSKLLAFTGSYNDPDESYYFESSDDEDLEEVYKKLFIKFMKLREVS